MQMLTTSQEDFNKFEKALKENSKNNNTEQIQKLLLNFELTATDHRGWNCIMYCCRWSSSPKVVELVFDMIYQSGGKDLCKRLLSACNSDGLTCLMHGCSNPTSSPEVMRLLFDKIVEAGGVEMLRGQFSATSNYGSDCVMLCCSSSSSEVLKLMFEEIVQVGGPGLLQSRLSATNRFGWNSLMFTVSEDSSSQIMELVCEKIVEAGGIALLKSNLTATNSEHWNCLMMICSQCSSTEALKFIIEQIVEAGETALLKSQLTATDDVGSNCLRLACFNSSHLKIMKLLAVVLFELGLFKQQYVWKLRDDDKEKLKDEAGIDSSSWTPDAASHAEIETLLKGGSFIHAIHNNQQSKIKEFLSNDSEAKKILDSNLVSIVRACAGPNTTLETVNVLFSEIELACGDQFLKDLLVKEENLGKTCLLSVSWSYPERLKLFLDIVDGRTGSREELLPEKKTRRDYESFLFYALIKFAPNYKSLSTLISKIFDSESFGRRFLREEFNSKPCLECLFARRLDSPDEMKMLLLMVSLYSITGVFGDRYSRLDKDAKKTLSLVCQIESGDWSRDARSKKSPMGDVIGEIKQSIKSK